MHATALDREYFGDDIEDRVVGLLWDLGYMRQLMRDKHAGQGFDSFATTATEKSMHKRRPYRKRYPLPPHLSTRF